MEPPVAMTPAIALRKALRVRICFGVMPCCNSFISSFPLSKATSSFLASVAGTPFQPIGEMPSISKAVDMVLAVN